jgi:hypothetical protein
VALIGWLLLLYSIVPRRFDLLRRFVRLMEIWTGAISFPEPAILGKEREALGCISSKKHTYGILN